MFSPSVTAAFAEPLRGASANREDGRGEAMNPCVLVIEGQAATRRAIARMFCDGGFMVHEAAAAAEGLARLADSPDLVVLDATLSNRDGFDLCRAIKGDAKTRAVLVVEISSQPNGPAERAARLDRGADAHLSHPVDLDELMATSRSLLRVRDIERERAQERAEKLYHRMMDAAAQLDAESRHLLYERFEQLDDDSVSQAERARDLFLAALGHDLRNPLHTIAAGCALVQRLTGSDDHPTRAVVSRMLSSVQRMNRLIENTLVLARCRVEGMPLERRTCDLVEICSTLVADLELRERERAIVLDAPEQLLGRWDSDRLAQVIDNLVSNALKYGEGGVWVTVGELGDDAVVSVHNWGPPIPSDVVPALFDPFRRVGRRGEGVGLGLYIVDQIVRAHGGRIAVESNDDSGTTFTVYLPRCAD